MTLHPTTVSPRPDWLPETVWPFPLREMNVAGSRMVYTDTGGEDPVVLFIHVGLWSLLWKDLIQELSTSRRCITLDVPGSGLSDPAPASLAAAAAAIGQLIEQLDLRDVTLVVHDTGGWATMTAVGSRPGLAERVSRLVAINTFGWQPRGILRLALLLMGSTFIREITAWSGFLAWASATRFGVGRHFDKPTKKAWRQCLRDRSKRRFLHRMFTDAGHDQTVAHQAELGLAALADRPTLTVFGQYGDYFHFRHGWRRIRPDMNALTVPHGLHFPQCDAPALVAKAISSP